MIDDENPRGNAMIAQVAIQQAVNLAKNFSSTFSGKNLTVFKYKDKGSMATIGKNKAVVEAGKLKAYGRIAWYIWMLVHLLALVGFNKKIKVFMEWTKNYFSSGRGVELILHPFDFTKAKKERKKEIENQ